MNKWKCAIALATCCCISPTMVPLALADFVGVTTVIKDDPDTAFLCTEGNGDWVPGPLTVCDVYVAFDEPADRLLVVENADLQVYDGAIPDVFFQHLLNFTPFSHLCASIDAFPDLICDSFLTIGFECGPDPPGTDQTFPDGFDFREFQSNGHIVGSWFNYDPSNGAGDAGSYPDLQVLILRSSVAQGLSLSGDINLWWVNAVGDLIHEVGIAVECAAACGSCPTDSDGDGDTDAADLAVLLGNWGPVDAGHCLDADDSGSIDAFDLAVLLGAWGPCP